MAIDIRCNINGLLVFVERRGTFGQ